MEIAGASVDIVKLGWGTALVSANLQPEARALCGARNAGRARWDADRAGGAPGSRGGHGAWLHELGLRHVEISDGTIEMEPEVKCGLIERLAREFTVLSEVGSKDAHTMMAPYVWMERIQGELQAGAWKVIAEARESGTAGIYRADGEVRSGLIEEIAHAVDCDRMIFEAPRKEQQVWLLETLRGGVQPRQHRAGGRAFAGDAAPGAALGHGRVLRAGRRGLSGVDSGSASVAGDRRVAHRARCAVRACSGWRGWCSRCWCVALLRGVRGDAAFEAHADGGAELRADEAFYPTRSAAAGCHGRVPRRRGPRRASGSSTCRSSSRRRTR